MSQLAVAMAMSITIALTNTPAMDGATSVSLLETF